MQSQVENQRSILHTNLISIDRPDSSQLVDLHVYIIPKKVWKNRQNLAENEVIKHAISVGFVHVPESLTIYELRQYINNICGEEDYFPKEFSYLRSVGRCLTKVKHHQEKELKVKNYRPPMTFAPEIYILGKHHNDDPSILENKKDYLIRELTMSESLTNSQTWIKPMDGPSLLHPLFNHNYIQETSTVIPTFSKIKRHSTRSNESNTRNSAKLRGEQERLYLLQKELARKRHELEEQHEKEKAAVKIQTAFRNYRYRRHTKQQQQQEVEAIKYERLQKERRKSIYQTNDEENKTHDAVKLLKRLKILKAKRIVLETNRRIIVHQLSQLHSEITIRRREETDLWRQKYFIEKNRMKILDKQDRIPSKNSTDIRIQLEQTTNCLNNATKLRKQAEHESRLLRQELRQISSTLNTLERY
ncbi:unnamed protein product [Rotaria sordida]|uniref:Spermatogenesis-associated protein 1 C-terminal domain-containing protein n=1 Tax=Rotaria sordida TaxID=392033 RepID=A0A814GTM7_9BILA|nr:unnamed protein product [Rotaria sordida]CAF3823031.1 unnamed protein product [Rotaria sordida]